MPWLVRDMIQAFDARADYASSELGDLFRSKTASPGNMSYLERMLNQFLTQDRFNRGYSFFTMLQECAWFLEGPHFHEVSCSVYQKSYLDYLRLLKQKAEELGAKFVTVGEFSRWYSKRYGGGTGVTTCLWSDIKYGSRKQYLWHLDRNFRVMFDLNQGGSICDLRPYGGKVKKTTGIDSPCLWDGAYPYLIQAHHRYGSICKGIVRWGEEEKDLSVFRAKVHGGETLKDKDEIVLEPILLEFSRGTLKIKTTFRFDTSGFVIERTVSVPGKPLPDGLSVEELFVGCWGTGDFQVNLQGLELTIDGSERSSLIYGHLGRTVRVANGTTVSVYIPEGNLTLSMSTKNPGYAMIQEGTLSEPMYRISLVRSVSDRAPTITVRFETHHGKPMRKV